MKSKSTGKTIVEDCDQCRRCRVRLKARDTKRYGGLVAGKAAQLEARARAGVNLRCKRSWRAVNDISRLVGSPQS